VKSTSNKIRKQNNNKKQRCESMPYRVARSLTIFSRTFCRFVTNEILLHAYFEYFLDIVVRHIVLGTQRNFMCTLYNYIVYNCS